MIADADQDRLRIGSSLTLEALAEQVMDLARQVGVKLAPPTVSWSPVPPNPNETLGSLLLDETTNRVVRRIRFSGPVRAAVASRVRYRQAMRVGRAARRTAKGMARGTKAGVLMAMQAPQILLSFVVLVLVVGLLYYLWVGARKVEWLTGEIVPSAAACGAGVRPAGFLWFGDQDDGSGTSFVDFTGAMGGWVSDKLDLSTESMIRGVHWTVETSGSVVATAQHTLQGGRYLPPSTGTAPPVVPAAFGTVCCPATGGGTTTAAYLPAPVQGPAAGGLSAEQTTNARTIIAVGKGLAPRVTPQAWTIAVATAMQESGLRNLDHGDRDSLGLFQQRPSQGWGLPSQITDPVYSANAFYTALLAVPGWERMPLTEAAQAVQRSGFPDAYARHEGAARQLVAQYGNVPATTGGVVPVSDSCASVTLPAGAAADGLSGNAVAARGVMLQRFGPMTVGGWGTRPNETEHDEMQGGVKASRALDFMTDDMAKGEAMAEYLLANAASLNVEYVIWDRRVNSADGRGWRPYHGRSPHTDHVHVTVLPDTAQYDA